MSKLLEELERVADYTLRTILDWALRGFGLALGVWLLVGIAWGVW